MKATWYFLGFGAWSLLAVLSVGSASAQTNVGKTIIDRLTAKISKLERSCATDIRKYCKDVTPGAARIIYCVQAHEDKIRPTCAFELGEVAGSLQATADLLKDGVSACKAEIAGVCGNVQPGEGRIAACLMANRSTASKECADAIRKVEAVAAE
jgi:Golgi apparatus protein 1